ncbi:helix-turn-helix transcriptional regulator [Filifactor villosus]|uniref:Helix-turn-helix transcriptional regulator n=1 Tax=Filifactor villosus TaxID=29374 RepID=A0ABV9QIG4_9FIRM
MKGTKEMAFEDGRRIVLYPGVELAFLRLQSDKIESHHRAVDNAIEINYCKEGRIGWKMQNGNSIYLGQGDFSLHTMKSCASAKIIIPNEFYRGLTVFIDLAAFEKEPPQLLEGTPVTARGLYEKFCKNEGVASFIGNQTTQKIFEGFYDQDEALRCTYYRLKTVELLLFIFQQEKEGISPLTEYHAEQVEAVREIHDWLVSNMSRRFTIEELSRKYLLNATTLKTVFKAVYGTSIAAHIKEHRMQEAGDLMKTTSLSIAEIARRVGYESQSKFTAAFKEHFHILPKEYRKKNIDK